MNVNLQRLYDQTHGPIAFLDESYEVEGKNRFYILACALVQPNELNYTRQALRDFYGGETMHAAPMYRRAEYASLRAGIELSAEQHDGLDLVVQTQLDERDPDGETARRRCIEHIVTTLHNEERVTLFVFDGLQTRKLELIDKDTFSGLRGDGKISRTVTEIHVRPSVEPLLGLPDLLAWSYRQRITVSDWSWFAPFEELARIHLI